MYGGLPRPGTANVNSPRRAVVPRVLSDSDSSTCLPFDPSMIVHCERVESEVKVDGSGVERLGQYCGIPRPDRLGGATLAKAGMPVTRERRSVYASPEELTAWVGTERGKKEPIHIAGEGEDLLGDLRQGVSYVRQR